MADLVTEQLDVQTPLIEANPLIATPYFEDYLYKVLTDLNAINDELVSGTVTDGANLGGGSEVFAQKDETILQFRSLVSSDASVTITQSDDELDLSASGSSLDPGTEANSILTWNAVSEEWTELPELTFSWSGGQLTMQIEADDNALHTVGTFDFDNGHVLYVNDNPSLDIREDEIFIDMDTDPTLTFSNAGIDVYSQYFDTSENEYVFRLQVADYDFRFLTSIAETMFLLEANGAVTGFYDGSDVFRSVAASSGGLEANNTSTGTGWERVLTTSDAGGGSLPTPTVESSILTGDLVGGDFDELTEVTIAWSAGVMTIQVEDDLGTLQDGLTVDADAGFTAFWDGNDVLGTTASGAFVKDIPGGNDQPVFELYSQADAQLGGIGYFPTATPAGVWLFGSVAGGLLSLVAEDSGNVFQPTIVTDPDGSDDFYFDGALVLNTTIQGIQVTATTGNSAAIELSAETGQNTQINLEEGTSTKFQFAYLPGSSQGRIRVSDTGDDLLLSNNVDGSYALFEGGGSSIFYEDGDAALATVSIGAQILDPSGANQQSLYFSDTLGVTSTFDFAIQAWSDTHTYLSNGVDSGDLIFRVRDEDSNTNIVIRAYGGTADDSLVEINYENALAARSAAGGWDVIDTSGDRALLSLYSDVPTKIGEVRADDTTDEVWLRSLINGGNVRLVGNDAGGTQQTGFDFDPDTGVGFNGATPIAEPDYTITNPTTNRSIDVSTITLSNLAQVVGTMIQDLIDYGLYA